MRFLGMNVTHSCIFLIGKTFPSLNDTWSASWGKDPDSDIEDGSLKELSACHFSKLTGLLKCWIIPNWDLFTPGTVYNKQLHLAKYILKLLFRQLTALVLTSLCKIPCTFRCRNKSYAIAIMKWKELVLNVHQVSFTWLSYLNDLLSGSYAKYEHTELHMTLIYKYKNYIAETPSFNYWNSHDGWNIIERQERFQYMVEKQLRKMIVLLVLLFLNNPMVNLKVKKIWYTCNEVETPWPLFLMSIWRHV